MENQENESNIQPATEIPPAVWGVTDPYSVTRFDRTCEELEEFLIFGIMVAGKNASVTEGALGRFYSRLRIDLGRNPGDDSPLELIEMYYEAGGDLAAALREAGIGTYTVKSEALIELIKSPIKLCLDSVSLEGLMSIRGIGPKTARFFLLHSRKDARVACLDTHIMKFLAQSYPQYNIPKSTPTESRYSFFEDLWLDTCDLYGVDSATLDLLVWKNKGDSSAVLRELGK